MNTYNKLFLIKTKLPLKKVLKVCLGFFLLLLIAIFLCKKLALKKDIFTPWWVWELADEGEIKTFDPISWKVADNSMILKISQQRPLTREVMLANNENSLQYALNKLKSTSFNQNEIQSEEKLKKIVVLQEKVAQKLDINQKSCGKCIISNDIADVHRADAVVIDDDYTRYKELPVRR